MYVFLKVNVTYPSNILAEIHGIVHIIYIYSCSRQKYRVLSCEDDYVQEGACDSRYNLPMVPTNTRSVVDQLKHINFVFLILCTSSYQQVYLICVYYTNLG